ncbi:MAG TPA: AAA family ATPase [Candidatus Nanoarchaeia archaeon]|nr:AAA family ATPase [Candidatus Nanoarchaeia archaeon]
MRNKEYEEMQTTILLLEEEVNRLREPPYKAGTVLQLGKKTVRLIVDGGSFIEVAMPSDKGLSAEIRKKLRSGARVILNGAGAIVDYSEFDKTICGEITTVDEINCDRLRVNVRGEPRMVLNTLKDVKVGDEVQLDLSGLLVTERFDRKKTRYVLEKIPQAPWNNIGGLEKAICDIRGEIEEPFLHRDIFNRYGQGPAKGILLYGPPGCGKTMIAKSIAYNLAKLTGNGAGHFISVKGPEILDKFVGNSEANIRRIYGAARDEAKESNVPTVVFIDEAESIMKARGSGISTDVYDSIVPQFLAEMSGLNGGDYEVVTVLATNREDIIDPAILRDGRVDIKIRIPRPDRKGAEQIFKIYLKDRPMRGLMASTKGLVEEIVERIYDDETAAYNIISPTGIIGSFGYQNLISGAMIKGIIDRGCKSAIRREIEGGKKGLEKEDLYRAVKEKFDENSEFTQALVRDDWEVVFGGEGKQLYEMYRHGHLHLQKADEQSGNDVKQNEGRQSK